MRALRGRDLGRTRARVAVGQIAEERPEKREILGIIQGPAIARALVSGTVDPRLLEVAPPLHPGGHMLAIMGLARLAVSAPERAAGDGVAIEPMRKAGAIIV